MLSVSYFASLSMIDVLRHNFVVYKRGKAIVPPLGAFHSTDIPEFYGTGDSNDFIGTDALSE